MKELPISRNTTIVTWNEPLAKDNVEVVEIYNDKDITSGIEYGIGKYHLTYTATDSTNNRVSCTFAFEVRPYGKYSYINVFPQPQIVSQLEIQHDIRISCLFPLSPH